MAYRDPVAYRKYMRKYMNERWKKRRAEAIERLGGKCVRCDSIEPLEFDHIDPTTKAFGVAEAYSRNAKDFWAEVDKCQLLCKPCHRNKTEQDRGVPHGGGVSGKKNCPCEPCKQRKALYMMIYYIANERKR